MYNDCYNDRVKGDGELNLVAGGVAASWILVLVPSSEMEAEKDKRKERTSKSQIRRFAKFASRSEKVREEER
jgi:hypothetical protein